MMHDGNLKITDHLYFVVLFIDKGNIGSHFKKILISDIDKHRI